MKNLDVMRAVYHAVIGEEEIDREQDEELVKVSVEYIREQIS